MLFRFKFSLCVLCASAVSLRAQLFTDTTKNVHYLAAPVIFNAPETGFGYGVSGSMSFKTSNRHDTLTRTSIIQVLGFWTTRKQNVQAIDANINFPKQKYIWQSKVGHSYYPDRFWGVGSETKDNEWERYIYQNIFFSTHLKKKITKTVFIGALYEFQYIYDIQFEPKGIFENGNFYGKQDYTMSGLGLSFCYDTRNISFFPNKGVFLQSMVTGFRKEIFSSYNVTKWICDFRFFQKTFKGQVFAAQLYNYATFGNTPLKQMASFGGVDNMRGFFQGRFRGNNMTTLIAEYRIRLYKRISMTLFGGTGNVFNDYSDFDFSNLKYSYGGGLRLALLEKEQLNIRLDYGYSNKFNKGFYFTIGECF